MTKKKQRLLNQQPVSPTVVWLAVIASTLVAILLYAAFFWLDSQSPAAATEVTSTQPELSRNGLIIFGLIVSLFVLGPGILVALIVLPIIRKNKKK